MLLKTSRKGSHLPAKIKQMLLSPKLHISDLNPLKSMEYTVVGKLRIFRSSETGNDGGVVVPSNCSCLMLAVYFINS